MRATNGGAPRYTAGLVPDDPALLVRFLREEFKRVQDALTLRADLQLELTTVAPTKPRDGMVRFADGTLWNPGSGRGYYGYSNSAWRFLG